MLFSQVFYFNFIAFRSSMAPQDLLTPFHGNWKYLPLFQRPVALATFSMPRYIRIMVLIYVAFFACDARAEDLKNLSVPIIVQFTNAGIAPASPGFVGDLSREVGVTLSYSQPASEDSHAFLVSGLFADFPLSDMLQRLQRRADVIFVTEGIASGASDFAHIVVKFSVSVADPSHPAFVWALSRDVGVTLAYLFEKTHGIQVFRVNGLSQSAQLAVILQRLKNRKDVLSAKANQ